MTRSWSFVMPLARRVGKTTALAEATRRLGGTLVCVNARAAQLTAGEFGVRTCSVETPERLRGRIGPVFFEPEAVAAMCLDYDGEILELRERLTKTTEQLDAVRRAMALLLKEDGT